MMRQATHEMRVRCHGRGMYEITHGIHAWLAGTGIRTGMLTLFVQHTSCSLMVQENADPAVQRDMERFFSRLVTDGDPMFTHAAEGPDDMSAHVRSALTQTSLNIPVQERRLVLGTWQGVFLFEHRTHSMRRSVLLHLIGE